jgi:Pyridoxamine 5'-phosphate oxidase
MLDERFRSLLEAPSPAVLTTYRRDRSALTSPVWFRLHADALEVVIAEGDVKLGDLARRPECTLTVFEATPPFRGVRIDGAPELIAGDVTEARSPIAGRYLGADEVRGSPPGATRTDAPSRFGWIRIVRRGRPVATTRVYGGPEVYEPGSCGQRGGPWWLVREGAASTQRWWCKPGNGDPPHRFTPTLTRQQHAQAAPHGFCLECSTQIEAWEGQAGARRYQFAAREVGEALALVARGATLPGGGVRRSPPWRPAAGRAPDRPRAAPGCRPGRPAGRELGRCLHRTPERGAAARAVPEVLVIDSAELRVKNGHRRGEGFHVIGAVGRDPGPPGRLLEPLRVWRLEASPVKDAAAFERFFAAHSTAARVW